MKLLADRQFSNMEELQVLSEPDEVTQQLIHEELEVGSQSAGVYGNHIGTFRKNFLFSSEAKTCWDALFSKMFLY